MFLDYCCIALPGNEKADELARNGSNSKFVGSEPAVARYAGLVKSLVKNETKRFHQERWEALPADKQKNF